MPISARGSIIGMPPARIVPAVIGSRPAIIINSVLLPQPLGPRRQTNSPLLTENVAAVIASKALEPVPKTLRTRWQLISACMRTVASCMVVPFSPGYIRRRNPRLASAVWRPG